MEQNCPAWSTHHLLFPLVARTQSGLCPIASVSQALALTPEATSNTQVFCYRSSTSATLSVCTYNTFMSFYEADTGRI